MVVQLWVMYAGERRIRVHTLCLPIASNLADILHGADQQCIVGLLAKMAADRAVQSSLSDAREAFVNVLGDVLSAFRLTQSSNTTGCMLAPASLRLLPLYVLALLKHVSYPVSLKITSFDNNYKCRTIITSIWTFVFEIKNKPATTSWLILSILLVGLDGWLCSLLFYCWCLVNKVTTHNFIFILYILKGKKIYLNHKASMEKT